MRKLIVLLAMTGCAQVGPPPVEQISAAPAVSSVPENIQQAAEQVAFRAVELAHPHTDPASVANCVRENATNGELLTLADGILHSHYPGRASDCHNDIATANGQPMCGRQWAGAEPMSAHPRGAKKLNLMQEVSKWLN